MVALDFHIKAEGLDDPVVKKLMSQASMYSISAPTAFFDRTRPGQVLMCFDDVVNEPGLIAAACCAGACTFKREPPL